MTKRIIAAVVCLAVALVFSLGAYFYLRYACKNLSDRADDITAAIDSGAYEEKVHAACEDWDESRRIFGALLKHSDADALDSLFRLLGEYADSHNTQMLEETACELKVCLYVILSGEKPAVEHIF